MLFHIKIDFIDFSSLNEIKILNSFGYKKPK